MLADLQSAGNLPELYEVVNNMYNGSHSSYRNSYITRGWKLSGPGDLHTFNCEILSRIISLPNWQFNCDKVSSVLIMFLVSYEMLFSLVNTPEK